MICGYCIVCDKELQQAFKDDGPYPMQPFGGVAFSSQGHYGSTRFDPMDGITMAQMVVCDDCFDFKVKTKRIVGMRVSKPKMLYTPVDLEDC